MFNKNKGELDEFSVIDGLLSWFFTLFIMVFPLIFKGDIFNHPIYLII